MGVAAAATPKMWACLHLGRPVLKFLDIITLCIPNLFSLCVAKENKFNKVKFRNSIGSMESIWTVEIGMRIILNIIGMLHKILRNRCPENLKGKFTRRNQISKYETSRMHDLQIPKPRLELSKRSFSYVGAKVWNDIPNAIRNVESTHLFKRKMKTHLLDQ